MKIIKIKKESGAMMMARRFTFDWLYSIIEPVKKVIKIATLNAITLLLMKGKGKALAILNLTATVFEVSPIRNKDVKWLTQIFSLLSKFQQYSKFQKSR